MNTIFSARIMKRLALTTALFIAFISAAHADDLNISWSSSDTGVATVSQSGTVLAVGTGACTITAASANGRSDSCKITVK